MRPPEELERLVPRSAEAVLVVPSPKQALERLRLFATALSQIPQGEIVGQALDDLVVQLGGKGNLEDLPTALGLDGARPMAAVIAKADSVAPEIWLALPVKDRGTLENRIAALAASRFGATEQKTPAATRFVKKDGALVAALHFDDRAGGTALIGFGSKADALVGASSNLPESASLWRSDDYQSCRRRWSDRDAWLYLAEAGAVRFRLPTTRGSGLGVALGKEGIRARGVALLSTAQSAVVATLVPSSHGSRGSLSGVFGPDAWLRIWIGADLSAIAASPDVDHILPGVLSDPLRAAGVGAHDLLADVGSEMILGLALSKTPSFRAMPSLDPNDANPFDFLVMRAAVRLREPDKAPAILAKVVAAAPRSGVTFRPHVEAGIEVETGTYARGESVSLAVADRVLLITGGPGEMERSLAAVRDPTTDAAPIPANVIATLRLDVPMLLAQVEAIPSSAFAGFTGLTLRSAVSRLAAPLQHIGPVTASFAWDSDALVLDTAVPLQ
jgi:hypothetical protein